MKNNEFKYYSELDEKGLALFLAYINWKQRDEITKWCSLLDKMPKDIQDEFWSFHLCDIDVQSNFLAVLERYFPEIYNQKGSLKNKFDEAEKILFPELSQKLVKKEVISSNVNENAKDK